MRWEFYNLQLTICQANNIKVLFSQGMAGNLSFLDTLVEDLIRSKHNNYSEECINYYIDDARFHIEDLPALYNQLKERIKATLIRHKSSHQKTPLATANTKCIIYLHGLGSSRLEALSIARHLPQNYCLCIFDLSGSGKSQGDYTTYGIKQQEDIDPVIDYLHTRKYIGEFVIWGRSMGAVATLLYAVRKYSDQNKPKGTRSAAQSLRNSRIGQSKVIFPFQEHGMVKAIVLDSPFHNYRDIAKEIATKRLHIPTFIAEVALDYVQESFTRILGGTVGAQFNPFLINFDKPIRLTIPTIFVYSEKDEIIPSDHCQRIIKNVSSKFEKMLINQCTHNQMRPESTIEEIINKLERFSRQQNNELKKLSESISRETSLLDSLDKKRGIFVCTPSKQIKKTTESGEKVSKFHEIIDLDQIKTEQPYISSPRKRQSHSRKNYICLESSKEIKRKSFETLASEKQIQYQFNSIDLQTNKLISKKLVETKQREHSNARMLRSKRINERKKEGKTQLDRYVV